MLKDVRILKKQVPLLYFSVSITYHPINRKLKLVNYLPSSFINFSFRNHDYLPSSYFFSSVKLKRQGTLMISYLQGSLSPDNISISLCAHISPIFPYNSPFKSSKCSSISPCVSFFNCFIFLYEVENQTSTL